MMPISFDEHSRQRPPTFTEIQTAWELLAVAIIRKAIEDYKLCGPRRRTEVERFIKSEYFSTISDIDPKWLLKTMWETMPPRVAENIKRSKSRNIRCLE